MLINNLIPGDEMLHIRELPVQQGLCPDHSVSHQFILERLLLSAKLELWAAPLGYFHSQQSDKEQT